MALNFPATPTLNQTYSFGAYTWQWDGNSWVGAVPIVNATINNTTIGAVTPSTGAFTTLSASSTVSGTGFSTYLASPPAIGSSAANTGAFTSLTSTSGAFNGTVGATTANTGSFTTLSASGLSTLNGTAIRSNQTPASGSGMELLWDGTESVIQSINRTGSAYLPLWYDALNHRWNTSGSQRMYLDSTGLAVTGVLISTGGAAIATSSGNVGIGTSSPYAKLSVANGSNENIEFTAGVTSVNGGVLQYINRTTNTTRPDFNYYLASGGGSHKFYTNDSERLRIDAAGNLGLGVTPSAWISAFNAMEFANAGSVSAIADELTVAANSVYLTGTNWTYKASGFASQYRQSSGQHKWFTAASGTAGTGISFTQAMTLFASGGLSVGNTSDPGAKSFNLGYQNGIGNLVGALNFTGYVAGYGAGIASYVPTGSPGVDYQDLRFYTCAGPSAAFAERARIDASGQLLLGTTTPVATGAGSLTVGATTASTSTTSGALTVAGGVGIAGNLNTGTNDNSAAVVYNSGNLSYNMLGKMFRSTGGDGTAQTLATFTTVQYSNTIFVKVLIRGCQYGSLNAWEDVGYALYCRAANSYSGSSATVTNVVNISGTHTVGTLSWLNVSGTNPVLQYKQNATGYGYPVETLDVYTTGIDTFGCAFNTAQVVQ